MKQLIVFLVAWFTASQSEACRVLALSPAEYAEVAEAVYFGVVTSVRISEESLASAQKNVAAVNGRYGASEFLTSADKIVTVEFVETWKGPESQTLEFTIPWCGGGDARVGSSVVAYFFRHWHLKDSYEAIAETREALKPLTSSF